MENVWADPSDSLFAYLQCRYGAEHHSFIFVNGQFLGNGFDFDVNNPRARYGGSRGVANGAFEALASAAGARTSCPFVGKTATKTAAPRGKAGFFVLTQCLSSRNTGLENLRGGDLQSCTQNNDRRATGWTRTGSCNWDARDGGYHEVSFHSRVVTAIPVAMCCTTRVCERTAQRQFRLRIPPNHALTACRYASR